MDYRELSEDDDGKLSPDDSAYIELDEEDLLDQDEILVSESRHHKHHHSHGGFIHPALAHLDVTPTTRIILIRALATAVVVLFIALLTTLIVATGPRPQPGSPDANATSTAMLATSTIPAKDHAVGLLSPTPILPSTTRAKTTTSSLAPAVATPALLDHIEETIVDPPAFYNVTPFDRLDPTHERAWLDLHSERSFTIIVPVDLTSLSAFRNL
ncbi:hypothetical protein HK101_004500, partial [Irineochytrium annulatum]